MSFAVSVGWINIWRPPLPHAAMPFGRMLVLINGLPPFFTHLENY
jgi:hypothetical protein